MSAALLTSNLAPLGWATTVPLGPIRLLGCSVRPARTVQEVLLTACRATLLLVVTAHVAARAPKGASAHLASTVLAARRTEWLVQHQLETTAQKGPGPSMDHLALLGTIVLAARLIEPFAQLRLASIVMSGLHLRWARIAPRFVLPSSIFKDAYKLLQKGFSCSLHLTS